MNNHYGALFISIRASARLTELVQGEGCPAVHIINKSLRQLRTACYAGYDTAYNNVKPRFVIKALNQQSTQRMCDIAAVLMCDFDSVIDTALIEYKSKT